MMKYIKLFEIWENPYMIFGSDEISKKLKEQNPKINKKSPLPSTAKSHKHWDNILGQYHPNSWSGDTYDFILDNKKIIISVTYHPYDKIEHHLVPHKGSYSFRIDGEKQDYSHDTKKELYEEIEKLYNEKNGLNESRF